MSFQYNEILKLPERSLLQKRLTKAFFQKNFTLTGAEKKLLANEIKHMEWLASIKFENTNISTFISDTHVFEELPVFVCTVGTNRLSAIGEKAAVLIQKYIPYHALIFVEDENEFTLHVCEQRVNLNDASKRTVEKYLSTSPISKLYKNNITEALFEAVNFGQLDKTDMQTAYLSWFNAVVQFRAANITGAFSARTQKRNAVDIADLEAIDSFEKEIISLANLLKKESNYSRQVDLNIRIQKIKKKIEDLKNKLKE